MKNLQYKGIDWNIYQGALIPDIGPHENIELTKEDKQYLLKESGAYFLRYLTQWDTPYETEFWHVIKDHEEDIQKYNSKKRNVIKKGLKNCLIKRVSKEIIAKDGYEVYLNSYKRFNNTLLSIDSKEEFYNDIITSNNIEYFAVYKKDTNIMIAYARNQILNNAIDYVGIRFDPEYLKLNPSEALIYSMNLYYLNEKKVMFVTDGARSISHESNIQEYLIKKFDFRKAYCRLNIDYRWDIKLVVTLLYPFRKLFNNSKNKILKKLTVLLRQEEIRRSYE